jgi:hypothetical protein
MDYSQDIVCMRSTKKLSLTQTVQITSVSHSKVFLFLVSSVLLFIIYTCWAVYC